MLTVTGHKWWQVNMECNAASCNETMRASGIFLYKKNLYWVTNEITGRQINKTAEVQ